MAEPAEVLASLSPLAQVGYGIATAFALGGLGIWQFLKTKSEEREKAKAKAAAAEHEGEHFDPSELLGAVPVAKFFADVSEIAVSLRLMAEGVRNISAVATIAGKRWEEGYDELRVWKAVDDRFEKLMARRQGPPNNGWGGGS